jgi:hypothetical protein
MAHLENDSYKEADCPCGEGQITKHISSTDYPAANAHVYYSLNCSNCSTEWKVEYAYLVNINSEKLYLDAKKEYDQIYNKLNELSKSLVKQYLKEHTFKTKKQELHHLYELNISNINYASYTKYRREGKSIYEIANGLSNLTWLMELADKSSQSELLQSLTSQRDEANNNKDIASKNIVKRKWTKNKT